jgi:uncharacterized protein (DUF934 family)
MFNEPVHHVYNSKNQVLAHSLTPEELEEILKPIEEKYEVITLDPPNYRDASY